MFLIRLLPVVVRVHGIDIIVNNAVISDAGVRNTFGTVCSKEQAKPPLVNARASTLQRSLMYGHGEELAVPCPSYVSLYVGLDVSDTEINIPATNIWHLASYDHDANVNANMEAKSYADTPPSILFISPESAKDPLYAQRLPGKSTIEVIALARYEWFDQWKNGVTKKHGADYEKMKRDIGKDLLEALEFHLPQIKGHIAFSEVASPLTVDHYREYFFLGYQCVNCGICASVLILLSCTLHHFSLRVAPNRITYYIYICIHSRKAKGRDVQSGPHSKSLQFCQMYTRITPSDNN